MYNGAHLLVLAGAVHALPAEHKRRTCTMHDHSQSLATSQDQPTRARQSRPGGVLPKPAQVQWRNQDQSLKGFVITVIQRMARSLPRCSTTLGRSEEERGSEPHKQVEGNHDEYAQIRFDCMGLVCETFFPAHAMYENQSTGCQAGRLVLLESSTTARVTTGYLGSCVPDRGSWLVRFSHQPFVNLKIRTTTFFQKRAEFHVSSSTDWKLTLQAETTGGRA